MIAQWLHLFKYAIECIFLHGCETTTSHTIYYNKQILSILILSKYTEYKLGCVKYIFM